VGCLRHNTIADNLANSGGQGVYVGSYATLAFTNTIIAGHSDAGITATTGSAVTLEATLWYSNGVHTGGAGTIVTGTLNVFDDPVFVNPAAGDYHLGIGSMAIDAGLDAGITTDIDGEPRIPPHDIGADEYVVTCLWFPIVRLGYP
jgi:hypothetical protein